MMAAITPVATTSKGTGFYILRNASAQADTGQTDWVDVPKWANFCTVYLNFTATAGTTPVITPSFLAADPIPRDDSYIINIGEHGALAGITAVNQYLYNIGPGITGIADDVTQSASADSVVTINAVLPALMGFRLVLDRADGNETYTYTLAAQFRKH